MLFWLGVKWEVPTPQGSALPSREARTPPPQGAHRDWGFYAKRPLLQRLRISALLKACFPLLPPQPGKVDALLPGAGRQASSLGEPHDLVRDIWVRFSELQTKGFLSRVRNLPSKPMWSVFTRPASWAAGAREGLGAVRASQGGSGARMEAESRAVEVLQAFSGEKGWTVVLSYS